LPSEYIFKDSAFCYPISSMTFRNICREALHALSRNWMRSLLTVLGIVVGVAAFICVVAIGKAGSSRIQDQLQALGDNFIWIEAGSRARNGVRAGARGTKTLVLGDAQAILDQVPLIKASVPNVDGTIQVIYEGQNWSTRYRGVTPEFLQVRRWNIRLGNFFSESDVQNNALVCVLGQTVVDYLFGANDPIDKVIRVKGLPCKVVGVFEAKGFSANGQDQDDFVVMPFTTVQKRITGTFWLDDIFVSAISRSAMPEALKEIEQLLRERHHITASEDPDFNVRSPEELLQAQLAASRILTMLLGTTAFLALLVGGIGIMNIMLVSVTQRTREIGVRMAVGATERDVQAQFLSEAMVLSVIGAVLGVAVGIAFSYIVDSVFLFPAKLTTETLLIGGLFSPLIGIVFGFYPAWKASQLDPIQGLRFE
jgi:putative ABC transport system permease protein